MKEEFRRLQSTKERHIAIDGDSSSGKTTVGKILSRKLSYTFIDSGLFYRAVTALILRKNAQEKSEQWIEIADSVSIILCNDSIYIDNVKINKRELYMREVDELVSPISTIKEIRDIITKDLRENSEGKNVVMSGRDIGTVVLKDAFLKIYLTANIEVRASRRFNELTAKGVKITYNEVLENLKKRDMIDSSRVYAPLSIARDAFVIDTTEMNVDDVVTKIILFLKGKEYAVRAA